MDYKSNKKEVIRSTIFTFIIILFGGILFGFLLKRNGPDGNHYFIISVMVTLIVDIIYTMIRFLKIVKKKG